MDAWTFIKEFNVISNYFEYIKWCKRIKLEEFDEFYKDDVLENVKYFKTILDEIGLKDSSFSKVDVNDKFEFLNFYISMFVLLNKANKDCKRYLDFENLKKAIVWSYVELFNKNVNVSLLELILCDFKIEEILTNNNFKSDILFD